MYTTLHVPTYMKNYFAMKAIIIIGPRSIKIRRSLGLGQEPLSKRVSQVNVSESMSYTAAAKVSMHSFAAALYLIRKSAIHKLPHYIEKKSHLANLISDKIHISKISYLTKFTFLKSHFCQNSHFENLIFDKIHIFQV